MWNDLPADVVDFRSLQSFKSWIYVLTLSHVLRLWAVIGAR